MHQMSLPDPEHVDEVVQEALGVLLAGEAIPGVPTPDRAAGRLPWHVHLHAASGDPQWSVETDIDADGLLALLDSLGLDPTMGQDAAAELANQVSGSVKGLLPGENQLTVPIGDWSSGQPLASYAYDVYTGSGTARIQVRLTGPCPCDR